MWGGQEDDKNIRLRRFTRGCRYPSSLIHVRTYHHTPSPSGQRISYASFEICRVFGALQITDRVSLMRLHKSPGGLVTPRAAADFKSQISCTLTAASLASQFSIELYRTWTFFVSQRELVREEMSGVIAHTQLNSPMLRVRVAPSFLRFWEPPGSFCMRRRRSEIQSTGPSTRSPLKRKTRR